MTESDPGTKSEERLEAAPKQERPSRTIATIVKLTAALVIFLIGYTDFIPNVIANSDFLMTFYSAGNLVGDGNFSELYPSANATGFAGEPFDKAVHRLLPELPPGAVAEYMYSPLVAWIFAPLTMGRPRSALIVWQILSALSLWLVAWIVTATASKSPVKPAGDRFWAAFLFLPAAITLWIGQIGVVFGLLPMALAYAALRKRLDTLAGALLSLLFLKPQFLALGGIIATSMALRKRPACLLAMLACIAVLLGLSIDSSSPEIFLQWLQCLKLSDSVYADPSQGVPAHLVVSLPRMILLALPTTAQGHARWLLYLCAAVVGSAAIGLCYRLMKRFKENRTWLPACFILAVMTLPLVAPYFFAYDLSLLLLAAWLTGCHSLSGCDRQLSLLSKILYVAITTYLITMMCCRQLVHPIMLVSVLLAAYVWIYAMFWKLSKPQATASAERPASS